MSKGSAERPRVVVVGGGFAGLNAVRGLRSTPCAITLVDRNNYHLFQPLLYQVATGALSPANIASPLRAVVRRQKNVQVWLGEVTGFQASEQRIVLADSEIDYDFLVVASGATHSYFGHEEWSRHAPGLKTLEDALSIRRRVFLAFEEAEKADDPEAARRLLTFAVVGGGPTGIELAGALAEIARDALRHDFRRIDPNTARIVLLEGDETILRGYPPKLSLAAAKALNRLGVQVRTGVLVTDIDAEGVTIRELGRNERLDAHTVLWAAGVRASLLGQKLAEATGVALDRAGRVVVKPDLSIPGFANVFVLGDLAHCEDEQRKVLPGTAPVAIQQGRYVASVIAARIQGRSIGPFRYRHLGNMATIGRAAAVVDLGWARFNGYLAWLAWLFVHLMSLVQFENRLLVLVQWAWCYLTLNRTARLITGGEPAESDALAPPAK